jgi:large subunit ribosomal protein L1
MDAVKKVRGKKYLEAQKKVDATKVYPLAEGVALAKATSTTAFDGSIEVHIRLGIDPKKSEQHVRGTIVLPHATGSVKRIAVFTETQQDAAKAAGADLVGGKELIAEIKSSNKCDFDVAVADPAMMRELAVIAKILGPKGLMPSPKNETVTPHIAKAVGELKRGTVTFKNDDTGNIHQAIGKVSLPTESLTANAAAFLDAVKKSKPNTAKGIFITAVTLAATMGPGIRVSA